MNACLKIILSLSLSGSILILMLILLRPIIRPRFSKRWQYYIWLIVIARMLFPFSLKTELSFTSHLSQKFNSYMDMGNLANIKEVSNANSTDSSFINTNETSNDVIEDSGMQGQTKISSQSQSNLILFFWQNLWLFWLIPAFVLLIRKITIYQSFVRYIRIGCTPIEHMNQLEQFGRLVAKFKIKSSVELYINGLISSPMLLGFFHPCILLPNSEVSDSDFQYTILHELRHLKRLDMFYKWLVQITVCLHWFNPLVYIMARKINQDCELSCDEAILQTLNKQEQRAYGDTLINALENGRNYKNPNAFIAFSESKKLLKERLCTIMNFKKVSKPTRFLAFILTLVLSFSASVIGIYATPKASVSNLSTSSKKDSTTTYDESSDRYLSISAIAHDGTWASASGIIGSTSKEQLDYIINYLEKTYEKKKETFIVHEEISAKEVKNIEGIQYMYDSSAIYRKLVTPKKDLCVRQKSDFMFMFNKSDNSTHYKRQVFYLDSPKNLELSISYKLDQGKMAVWILSPDGTIIYKNKTGSSFNKTIEKSLEKGLYSIVVVYKPENSKVSGTSSIQGTLSKSSK